MGAVVAKPKPTKRIVRCNQCGYEWPTRKAMPKQCTRCKRYDWNEPKKGESNANAAD